jgi:glycine/D-amino acid oxidase-like deaminating enzyme
MPTRPRVAVVGSGLAGLTSAYLLAKEGADVWLIDKVRARPRAADRRRPA